LSVEISTSVSSAVTVAPGSLAHSTTDALGDRLAHLRHHDVDGDRLGLCGRGRVGVRPVSRVARRLDAADAGAAPPDAPLVGAISASTAPTSTVSPSAAWTLTSVPRSARAPRRRPCP
jgi:hypothetical protein